MVFMVRTGIAVLVMGTLGLTGACASAPAAAPAASAPAAAPAVSATVASSCAQSWGTGVKQAGHLVRTKVMDVRAGQHTCFDRLVIDLGAGPEPGYTVRYVNRLVEQASGRTVGVRGSAKLSIVVRGPAAGAFPANSHHLVSVSGFRNFRQVVGCGSFEGITGLGMGLRAKLPLRVFWLRGPGTHSRLVIDVANS
jgi:hypothetical protein